MKKSIITLFFASLSILCPAQNKLFEIHDAVVNGRTTLAPKKLAALNLIPGSEKFAYLENSSIKVGENSSGKIIYTLDLKDINAVLKSSSKDTLSKVDLNSIKWKNESAFYCSNSKCELIYSVDKKSITESDHVKPKDLPENMDEASNGLYAFTKDNNLFIHKDGKDVQLTKDGSYNLVYGKSVHRDEFGIHKGTYWSPSANFLAFYRMDQSDVFDYPVIDWTKKPAENKNIKYPMAGTKSHYVTLGVYDLKTGSTIYLKTEGPKDQYLTNIQWGPDEKHIYIAVLNREQNHMKLNEYDAASGNFIRTLFEEKDEKYVEPMTPMLFLKNEKQFIWLSRRDGYKHAYLYSIDGKLIKQLTKGNWEIKEVNGFDESYSRLFFHANEQSPVNQDFYSVDTKTGEMKRLTYGNGFHTATIDKKGAYFIDNFQSAHVPREYNIVNTNSKKAVNIFKAENPIKDYQLANWNLFSIKNGEGTDLFCRLFKPANFDSTKKYPVLIYLYNGPHSQMVTNTWMAGGEVWYHYMAQKGYIIFTLDGRGTSHRGKAFEQAIHRQVGTREMEDQLKGVEYLKSLPYVDASRIGVHGWSYGGFMTTSLMTRNPGVFKVAVAGGPVIDWSYYEIMYTERYMDTPQENKEGYEKNNLLNHVDKLKGKLLMIHGAQDDVVVWQHSVMYQKKAVDHGILVDYYMYPGHPHNVMGKDRGHLMDKICTYFLENL
jgi:dipeptidyl-peptidase 4